MQRPIRTCTHVQTQQLTASHCTILTHTHTHTHTHKTKYRNASTCRDLSACARTHTQQHTAAHSAPCNTRMHAHTEKGPAVLHYVEAIRACTHIYTHTATHYNAMQHTTAHCSTLQPTATYARAHTQNEIPQCVVMYRPMSARTHTRTHAHTQRHAVAHCNTLQNTHAHTDKMGYRSASSCRGL